MKYLTNLDLNKNELQNARVQNLATAPLSPVVGQVYFNIIDKTGYIYDGTSWRDIAQIVDLSTKQDTLVSGENIKTINGTSVLGSGDIEISSGGGGTGGTTDYDELVNHPKINGVELVGDKSTSELGINIPTKISDLEDDGYLVTVKTGERRWATYAQG